MGDPYAGLTDLTDRFPAFNTAQTVLAEILLVDASFWLGVWVPGLAAAVEGGDETLTEAAKLIVVAMVKRALPAEDTAGVSEDTVGPFKVVYRNPEGSLFLYGRELDDLLELLMPGQASAVSMRSPGL